MMAFWQPFPHSKPTLGFGLYPVMFADGEISLLYYHPRESEDYVWQDDGVNHTDIVTKFVDLTLYPGDVEFARPIARSLCRTRSRLRRWLRDKLLTLLEWL